MALRLMARRGGSRARRLTLISWRDARAAESARLESVCGETHRGFESHSLRHGEPRARGRGVRHAHAARGVDAGRARRGAGRARTRRRAGRRGRRPRRRSARRPPQRARAHRRSHRARRDPGAARRRRGDRSLAARRLHPRRHTRAVRDVRRGDGQRPSRTPRLSVPPIRRPAPPAAASTCSTARCSTIVSRGPSASGPTSAERCSSSSSPLGGRR